MSLITIKTDVIVSKQVVIACAVVNAANELKLTTDMQVTSGRDGKHMPTSKHYVDQALDFRTHGLPLDDKYALLAVVKRRLGADYDVIIEDLHQPNEHLHAEYDPK